METTDRMVAVAKAVQQLLEEAKVQLGIKQTFYGDQNKIAVTPTVCVEPGTKKRDLQGVPRATLVTMEVMILIYLYKLGTMTEGTLAVDVLAEDVEAYLHNYPQMDGLVIHSYATVVEYGYAQRDNSAFRTVRITFETTSKVHLPLGGV